MGNLPARFFPPANTAPPISRSSISTQLYLLWLTVYRPSHSLLPRNIAREVCLYLSSYQPQLLKVTIDDVFVLDDGKQWTKLFPIKDGLFTRELKSVVMLDDEQVFICGGYRKQEHSRNHQDYEGVFLLTRTSKRRLVDLNVNRLFHGIVYDPFTHSVFLFGGLSDKETPLQSAEQFSLKTEACDLIPDMCDPRSYFQPCRYSHLIILCGGATSESSELFDIATGSYRLLPMHSSPKATLSVVVGSEVVTLSGNVLRRWSLTSAAVAERTVADEVGWCACPALLTDTGVCFYSALSYTRDVKVIEL